MKKIAILSALIFIIFPITAKSDFSEHNTEKTNWVYSQLERVSESLENYIQSTLDTYFGGDAFSALGDAIGEKFGQKFAESLSGIISIGPLLSFSDLVNIGLGINSPSESEIMLKILLEAISEAKEEIIQSIDEAFEDETRARLNTIIRDLALYNTSLEEHKEATYYILWDLITDANYVMERIEARPHNHFENLHHYMTVAALQIEMHKEYRHRLSRDITPWLTDDEIDDVIRNALSPQIDYVNNFLSYVSRTSNLSLWQQYFRDEFNFSEAKFVKPLDPSDPIFDHPDRTYIEGSGIYSYRMGEHDIEFKVVLTTCRTIQKHRRINADLFDANGQYAGNISRRLSCSTYPNNNVLTAVNGSNGLFNVVNRHATDQAAFDRYLVSGYESIYHMINTWWEMTNNPPRQRSEVDDTIENVLSGIYSDVSVSMLYGGETHENGTTIYHYTVEVENIGFDIANDVSLNISYSGGPIHDLAIDPTSGTGQTCESHTACQFDAIPAGEARSAVLSIDLMTQPEGDHEFLLDVTTSSPEVILDNNYTSYHVNYWIPPEN